MGRLLITGSRNWVNDELILVVLSTYSTDSWVLVSGACPTGVDHICERHWESRGGVVERYPADWNRWGKRAGFTRNANMVQAGADMCIAFIRGSSKGATMTADLAEKAGIHTIRYLED